MVPLPGISLEFRIAREGAAELAETYHMTVALLAVGLSLLTESSPKVRHFGGTPGEISIPPLPEDACYQWEKLESTYGWVAELVPSQHLECFLD
jgi:hypothetical protein